LALVDDEEVRERDADRGVRFLAWEHYGDHVDGFGFAQDSSDAWGRLYEYGAWLGGAVDAGH